MRDTRRLRVARRGAEWSERTRLTARKPDYGRCEVSDDIDLTDDEYDTFIVDLAEQRCQHSHADTACPPPPERAILTDLIAELRRSAKGYLSPGAYAITVKEQLWLADWAETRLRDVSMSLSKGHDDE